MEFDLSPDDRSLNPVFVVYGDKGSGKTTASILSAIGEIDGFNMKAGTVAIISFDYKGQRIASTFGDNVIAYNGLRYSVDDSEPHGSEAITRGACKNFMYLFRLLASITADVIIIDGSEILTSEAELLMRYNNKLGISEGFANRSLWKERKAVLKRFHRLCMKQAAHGVYYTTYIDEKASIKDGEILETTKHPAWVGTLLHETDIVVRVKKVDDRYFAKVESSKIHDIVKEQVFDITEKKTGD